MFLMVVEEVPRHPIVIFAIRFDKGRLPGDGAAHHATRAGIVVEGDADRTGFQVLDILPADDQISARVA